MKRPCTSFNACDKCLIRGYSLFVGCWTSQQQASVSQGRICSDNFMCCHTEIEVADQTFHLTQSQYTDTGPNSPSADPITPGAWQGSHWSANFWHTCSIALWTPTPVSSVIPIVFSIPNSISAILNIWWSFTSEFKDLRTKFIRVCLH